MREDQRELMRKSALALESLKAMRGYLAPKKSKSDNDVAIIDILDNAIATLASMRDDWLVAIGHPETISDGTLAAVLDAVSAILKGRAENGSL